MGTGTAYRIVDKEQASVGRDLSAAFAGSLARDGQSLLPIAELIASGRAMVDEVIDVMGRATIEALLGLSATQVAGARHQGKAARDGRGVHRFGFQPGVVPLCDRALRVTRPRVRTRAVAGQKSRGVPLPAYEAMPAEPDRQVQRTGQELAGPQDGAALARRGESGSGETDAQGGRGRAPVDAGTVAGKGGRPEEARRVKSSALIRRHPRLSTTDGTFSVDPSRPSHH